MFAIQYIDCCTFITRDSTTTVSEDIQCGQLSSRYLGHLKCESNGSSLVSTDSIHLRSDDAQVKAV